MRASKVARLLWPAVLTLALGACAGGNYRAVSDTPVRIGPAYSIRGTTYVPAAAPIYDEVGHASWYGSESGNRTNKFGYFGFSRPSLYSLARSG